MTGEVLREARGERGWTQAEAGARLGVSQTYVALLEKGRRRVPADLARKAVRVFRLSPALLPVREELGTASDDELARDLGLLGYPGFAYLRGRGLKNPGEVLLTALAQANLDSRVAEALPWVFLRYPELDRDWLVRQARLSNLTNRLGFVVDLAKRVLERKSETNSPRYGALSRLSDDLRLSRLAGEDTLGQHSLTKMEREWLRKHRPEDAQFWHLLTNWQPEFLQYTL